MDKADLIQKCRQLPVSAALSTTFVLSDYLLTQREVDELNERLNRELRDGSVVFLSLQGSDGSEVTAVRYMPQM